MRRIRFTKMHALGNDFLIPDMDCARLSDLPSLAANLCDRHTGVGADGILLAEPSNITDIKMRILNSDGSEPDMCGNGLRCFAKYVFEHGIVKKECFTVETGAGIMRTQILLNNGEVAAVSVNMGKPSFDCASIPMLCTDETFIKGRIHALDREFEATALLMGVPHLVVLLEYNLGEDDIRRYGRALEHHAAFPNGTNVNFIRIDDDGGLSVRTWERGCGITLACGTGSCACAAASAAAGYLNVGTITVRLALGELSIRLSPDGDVHMTGPATEVFRGETIAF